MKPRSRDIALCVILVVSLVCTIFLGYLVMKEEEEQESNLQVDEVYFVMIGANSVRSQVEIVVFVSNVGEKDVSKLEIRAFIIDKGSNLAMDESSATINDVIHETTVEGNLIVEVPNDDQYRVELLFFMDEKLEVRGSGSIDLSDIGSADDYRNYYDLADDDDDMAYGAVSETTNFSIMWIFCLLFFIVAGIVGVAIYASVKASRKVNIDKVQEQSEFRRQRYDPRKRLDMRMEEFEDQDGSKEFD